MPLNDQIRSHGLRVTGPRVAILRLLQESDRALSQQDVEAALPGLADRVTLFRVLQAFEEAGLAHKVMDHSGVACYAACSTNCSSHRHSDTHAHFRCTTCGSVFCLDNVEMPSVKVPRGFKVKESHLELEGSCKECA
jgi:Fur family ferric uptake transcriptional regulator